MVYQIFAVREPWHAGSFTEEAKREGHVVCRRSNPAAGKEMKTEKFLIEEKEISF